MKELRALIEVLGEDDTLKIVEAFGGTRLVVPDPSAGGRRPMTMLRTILAPPVYALLTQRFGGIEIAVPMARQWRFGIYIERNLKPKEIARRAGCTEAAVYAYLRARANDRQARLPFEEPERRAKAKLV